jgi:hypothetical protein
MARQVSRGVSIAPGGAKLVHAQLMRPIGRSRNVVRMLAATLVPEHCSSGHCGKLCRWSHLISSAKGQRNCWPTLKVCGATHSVKYQPSSLVRSYSATHCRGRSGAVHPLEKNVPSDGRCAEDAVDS